MATLTRALQQNSWLIYATLFLALAALLVFSPAEARLGDVVKIVYAHGAAERVATYAYLIAGGLGLVSLVLRASSAKQSPIRDSEIASSHPSTPQQKRAAPLRTLLAMTIAAWTRAIAEIAIVFWLAHIVISAPAQVLAWGAFTLSEPRVASALVVLIATALVYVVARWLGDPTWLALAAIANAAILVIGLRGAINILHPVDPIVGSDSPAIKVFYAAIVVVAGLLALQMARERARSLRRFPSTPLRSAQDEPSQGW
ncbi:MAG: hypothetical protein AB1817_13220 [Chloroflexota bacterium]